MAKYRGKLSGPLLDRIDIHVEMPAIAYGDMRDRTPSESSRTIRARVQAARARQQARFAGSSTHCNAQMTTAAIRAFCRLDDDAQQLLKLAVNELGFSARAYDKVLRISRTIADLAGAEEIAAAHVSEAVQCRNLDRKYWER